MTFAFAIGCALAPNSLRAAYRGQALIDRLGADHGSMHWGLVGLFVCSDCKSANHNRRPASFTVIPDYEGQQRERNRDWKPSFG